ncbi:MAG TPA: CARDB domain-containing protein [Terriglobales bacterium]|nr:CARDB domain-containing protein [Terriglobales bacterium]
MKNGYLRSVSLAVLCAVSLIVPATSEAQSRPAVGKKAGNITQLLPMAKITRGSGKSKAVLEAKKGDDVAFNDLIQTEKGGRARITLLDQSILSLGSQAELRITQHDPRTQQTAMQLGYGRVRAQVASITRDGGRFELRTPTAVAGVIGTDFGTDSSVPGVTSFICISGLVSVSNADPNVPGAVQCPAGTTTTVTQGNAPTAPKPATQQQIQQLIQDTEPAVISALSPASALLGTTVDTVASGSKMNGINAVSISGEGVTVSLLGNPTETAANVKITVAATAAPGTRTLTFTKANGQTTAAVFSILAPPTGGGGGADLSSLKAAYLEILEQERQSAIAGVNAVGIGVQQSAADTGQAILNENNKLAPPLDLGLLENDLKNDIAGLVEAMTAAGTSINEETAKTRITLDAALVAAQNRLAQLPTPPTETEKAKVAKDIFDGANAQLLAKFKGIQDGLGGAAKSTNAKFLATMARWTKAFEVAAANQRALPIPRVDADERAYDLGLMAAFDASRSTGTAGSSITSYSWALCDPGYKPQQVGVPLPASDNRCRPLSGFAATAADFKFPTCQLVPQDYIARVTITDTSNKSAAMDVRVRVLPPQYENPSERLHSLTDTYQQLQPNRFTSFFDESFSGLTELQESIRRTFASLASMSINLRVSQANIGCNEATIRADWDQNYTFKEDQTCVNAPLGSECQRVVFRQSEQLTARMKRIPGKNWYITDFQGDNGTVQGTPPGPIQRDTSLPDFHISALTISSAPAAAAANRETEISAVGIAPGVNNFAAIVENIGTAPLQGTVKVRFVARDSSGAELASDIRDLAGPLDAGGSASVVGTLNIPDLGPGIAARIFAAVNPGCVVIEQNCDGANATLLDIIIGTVDLQVVSFAQVGTAVGTQTGQINVQIKNIGTRASFASANNLKLFFGTTPVGAAGLPAINAGATVTVPLTFTAPNVAGSQPVTVAIAPSSIGEVNPANDLLAGTLSIQQALVNLNATGLAFSGSAPPFLSGQSVNVTLNVANTGNVPSAPSNSLACKLVGTAGTQNFAPQPLPAVATGASLNGLVYTFIVPINFAGTNTLTCAVSKDPLETVITDNQTNLGMVVGLNVDLQIINVPTPTGADQMGGSSSVPFDVKNFGLDVAPAGWNVVLGFNGTPAASFVSTGPLPGGSSTAVILNYVTPQLAPAPADITNVAAQLKVNANNAIQETNTANNIFSATLRFVDFTITAGSGGNIVAGRNMNLSPAVTVAPISYPLPLTVNYSGLPAGTLTSAGAPFGQNIAGIPSSVGTFNVSASATVDGVTRTMTGTVPLQVLPEIALSLGTAFGSLTSGGTPQPLQVAVAGGVYPVTVNLGTLPTGISTTSPTSVVLTAPGSVTWQIQAAFSVSTGSFPIIVNAIDGGISATSTPPGNVSLPVTVNVNGQANYVISNAALGTPHTTGTGADSLQVGETANLNFLVSNLGGLSQTGTISIDVSSGCGAVITVSVPAPPAGGNSAGTLSEVISCSPGAYTKTLTITAAPPESNTSDNSFGPLAFEVFDFAIGNLFVGTQNVPLAGSGIVNFQLNQTGPAAPLTLQFLATSVNGKAVTSPAGQVGVNATSVPVSFMKSGTTLSGDPEVIDATITRLGVSKTASHSIHFYTAQVDNISSGQPGSSSGNPVLLPINGPSQVLSFKIIGDYLGNAIVQTPVVPGFSVFLLTAGSGAPFSTFDFDIASVTGAPTTGVTAIPITFNIPDTFPQQTVSTNLYVKAYAVPNLTSDPPVPAGNFAGRAFTSAQPLLAGESGDLNITVRNIGAGPSSPGMGLKVTLGTLPGAINTSPVTLPSIPAGGNVTVLVHVRAPDSLFTGISSFDVNVESDPLELDTANNISSLAIDASDWSISVNGAGSQFSPLTINVPSPGTSTAQIDLFVNNAGSTTAPISTTLGVVSSFMTAILPSNILTTQPVTIAASTSPAAPDGAYAVQVIAKMMDGAVVTAQRSTVIHVTVNSGLPVDLVTIASSANNACISACTPVQIDGLLVESITLTPTRSGGSSGATDLIFSDDGDVISRVTAVGAQQPQQLTAMPYGVGIPVNFAAEDDGSGNVFAGPSTVTVSATAVSTAARNNPRLDPVGSQQTTLQFNVGDVDLNYGCIAVTPGQSQIFTFNWSAFSGFNQNVSWNWVSTGGANFSIVSGASGSGMVTDGVPSSFNTTFQNNATAQINESVQFVLAVTITNANGSATKFIPVDVYLNTLFCTAGAEHGAANPGTGTKSGKGYWKRGASAASSIATRAAVKAVAAQESGLPDLQIKPVDVSISPSIPKPGDTLDVRFKLSNAGDGNATNVPVALMVNGKTVATETYSVKAGGSTLGGFQWALPAIDNSDRPIRNNRFNKVSGGDADPTEEVVTRRGDSISAQLVVDPTNSVKQKSTAFKQVALTKVGLGNPVDVVPAERVYLEMSTICMGFRMTSGSVGDCEGGADLDISIEDFKTSRFALSAQIGVADIGVVEPNVASADSARFESRATLVLGHTYAVQMTGGKIGFVKFSASLTPRQLEAEARRRFGLNGVRILRKLGGDTGSTTVGDVAGKVSADALMYFDMTFRP